MIQAAVVAERAPFHVDDHLFRLVVVAIPCADAIELLHVARIGACAQDEADARVRILVGSGHHRSDGIVDQSDALNVDSLRVRREIGGATWDRERGRESSTFSSIAV